MARNKYKNRQGVVYSTDPNFQYREQGAEEEDALPAAEQHLRVQLDKKSRGGKKVTLVTGYSGPEEDLKALGKMLKSQCGVGGSAKNGEILVQGDFVDRVVKILLDNGYNARKI